MVVSNEDDVIRQSIIGNKIIERVNVHTSSHISNIRITHILKI